MGFETEAEGSLRRISEPPHLNLEGNMLNSIRRLFIPSISEKYFWFWRKSEIGGLPSEGPYSSALCRLRQKRERDRERCWRAWEENHRMTRLTFMVPLVNDNDRILTLFLSLSAGSGDTLRPIMTFSVGPGGKESLWAEVYAINLMRSWFQWFVPLSRKLGKPSWPDL